MRASFPGTSTSLFVLPFPYGSSSLIIEAVPIKSARKEREHKGKGAKGKGAKGKDSEPISTKWASK